MQRQTQVTVMRQLSSIPSRVRCSCCRSAELASGSCYESGGATRSDFIHIQIQLTSLCNQRWTCQRRIQVMARAPQIRLDSAIHVMLSKVDLLPIRLPDGVHRAALNLRSQQSFAIAFRNCGQPAAALHARCKQQLNTQLTLG